MHYLEDKKLITELLSGVNVMRRVMYNALNSDLNKMRGGQISSKNKPLLHIWIPQQFFQAK